MIYIVKKYYLFAEFWKAIQCIISPDVEYWSDGPNVFPKFFFWYPKSGIRHLESGNRPEPPPALTTADVADQGVLSAVNGERDRQQSAVAAISCV